MKKYCLNQYPFYFLIKYLIPFSMPMERLRFAGPGFPMSAPVFIPPPPSPSPGVSMTPPSPINPMVHNLMHRFGPPMGFPTFTFTQSDLDLSLYGYSKTKQSEKFNGHALSGLRNGSLNHGEYNLFTIFQI